MFPLAHLGHWFLNVLYALPVALIGAAIWYAGHKLEDEDEDESDDELDAPLAELNDRRQHEVSSATTPGDG